MIKKYDLKLQLAEDWIILVSRVASVNKRANFVSPITDAAILDASLAV
jgi:hypothetical protein